MIRASRALRMSVQNRLVSQYGKSEEYSPNGNWATRDEWFGQANNAPDVSDRRAELNSFFWNECGLERRENPPYVVYYYFNKGEPFYTSRCFREVGLFALFIIWRLYRVQHIKEEIKDAPANIGHAVKPIDQVHVEWWHITGCL